MLDALSNKPIALVCDCCKKRVTADNIVEWREFLRWDGQAGYGSIFGDGNQLMIDLCQKCVKRLLGEYLRIEKDI